MMYTLTAGKRLAPKLETISARAFLRTQSGRSALSNLAAMSFSLSLSVVFGEVVSAPIARTFVRRFGRLETVGARTVVPLGGSAHVLEHIVQRRLSMLALLAASHFDLPDCVGRNGP